MWNSPTTTDRVIKAFRSRASFRLPRDLHPLGSECSCLSFGFAFPAVCRSDVLTGYGELAPFLSARLAVLGGVMLAFSAMLSVWEQTVPVVIPLLSTFGSNSIESCGLDSPEVNCLLALAPAALLSKQTVVWHCWCLVPSLLSLDMGWLPSDLLVSGFFAFTCCLSLIAQNILVYNTSITRVGMMKEATDEKCLNHGLKRVHMSAGRLLVLLAPRTVGRAVAADITCKREF